MIFHCFSQAKVDNIGMYHSIVKDLDEYNRGTDLMRNIGIIIQRKPLKYTVNLLVNTSCTLHFGIYNNSFETISQKNNVLICRRLLLSTTRTTLSMI